MLIAAAIGNTECMKTISFILSAAVLLLVTRSPASAQATTTTIYVDTDCGAWQGDTWVPSGKCAEEVVTLHKHERVAGTITIVKGHLVTVQQASRTVVIDDTQALQNQLTGRVAVGRSIVAHGYWSGDNFYATLITTGEPPPQ